MDEISHQFWNAWNILAHRIGVSLRGGGGADGRGDPQRVGVGRQIRQARLDENLRLAIFSLRRS